MSGKVTGKRAREEEPKPSPAAKKGKATPAKASPAAKGGKASPAAAKKTAASAKKAPAAKKPATKKGGAAAAAASDDDDEEEGATKPPPAKRAKTAATGKKAAAAMVDDGEEEGGGAARAAPPKKLKELKPLELIEAAMKAYRWWESAPLPAGIKWRTMEHCGVLFPPTYTPHGVKMRYADAEVSLTPEQEEMATFYASIPLDGPQLGSRETAKIFNKNFWADFKAMLGPDHVIQDFKFCDFGPLRAHLTAKKEEKKGASKEAKEAAKEEKNAIQMAHGFALVDGHLEKMGNYNIEPPGLFRGRGLHPKMGTLKRRVMPEDITINVATTAVVPPCPLPGHAWKQVVHDPSVTWLAYWKENVMGNTKYVHLAASSSFKGQSDLAKYEKARKLKTHIESIRAHYCKLLSSNDDYERQSGIAMWVIDRLALRVGGEKDEDEADTVGCCSLRVEHLSFGAPAEEGGAAASSSSSSDDDDTRITLDFLGKDSMRYHQTIDLASYGSTGRLVLKNLKALCKGKKPEEDVFDQLNPSRLNEQLQELMPGLSAKVFRTYNASITLQSELENMPSDARVEDKVLEYNRANREVAILCNHQRTVPKAFEATWVKMLEKEALLASQLAELEGMVSTVRKGADVKLKPKEDGAAVPKDASKEAKDAAAAEKARVSHLFQKQPTKDELDKRIVSWREKLDKHRLDMRNKDENKAVALGTSKINYMDPRITVAWCKKVELPIEKVFPTTLRDKFPWAMGVPSDFVF